MGTFHIPVILQRWPIQNLTISHSEQGGFVKSFNKAMGGEGRGATQCCRGLGGRKSCCLMNE